MRVLRFDATWMEVEGVILSETSQRGKDTYQMVSFICSMETEPGKQIVSNEGKPSGLLLQNYYHQRGYSRGRKRRRRRDARIGVECSSLMVVKVQDLGTSKTGVSPLEQPCYLKYSFLKSVNTWQLFSWVSNELISVLPSV